ncbi:MAG: hypothetical protein QG599_3481 [Pseudomonadota bacterium]|nr:hypothetical protein [Pseudomonadota bacterium]
MNNNRSNTPFILIETPRAGKWNHRHIVAPGIPQQAYLDIIETARQKSEGDNFLAVGHNNKVKQFTTDRYAPELLILAGIDTKRLSKNQKQALQDSLTSLLSSVDKLVTENIDWNREGENDPVVREELAVWFNLHFKVVEAIAWNPKLKRLSKKIMPVIIATTVLVLLGLVSYFGFKIGEKPKESSDVVAANQLIQMLSDALSGDKGENRKKVSEELEKLNLIELVSKNSERWKISSDRVKQIDFNKVTIERVFPGDISRLFLNKENSINLNSPQIVKDLIACKEQIINFATLQNTNTSYTPFITLDQVDKLKKEITDHRKDKNEFYSGVISGNEDLKTSCGEDLAKNNPLKFLKDCYRDYGIKNHENIFFWKKAKSLLDSCGEIKL